jgi:membrane protease YdiL (CAAX protease family)
LPAEQKARRYEPVLPPGRLPAAVAGLFSATGLWFIIFALEAGNFWLKLALSAGFLGALTLFSYGRSVKHLLSLRWRHLLSGVISAATLYLVFWLGKIVLTGLSSGAAAQISSVYGPRETMSLAIVTLLLLLVTSPSEELFWRGLLQKSLMDRLPRHVALLLASFCYAAVHLWTLNLPLVLAALAAGLLWGALFIIERSLVPVIISHALWSVAIFVLWPLA